MEENFWADITIDISKLEDCKETIKIILDTVISFSVIDLPIELCKAYWALSNAIKWLKVLNGDTKIDDVHPMWEKSVCDIRETHRYQEMRLLRGHTPPEGEIWPDKRN